MDLAKVFYFARLAFLTSVGSRLLKQAREPSPSRTRPSLKLEPIEMASLAAMMMAGMCASIPRIRVPVCLAQHVTIYTFDDILFKLRFRFRQEHVWLLLQELHLLTADGDVRVLQVGRVGHTQAVRADTALLITLRKLSYVCRVEDLVDELGCSRTLITEAFNAIITYLYDEFASRLNRLDAWVDLFPDFASAISSKIGGMFTNVIGFTDGYFQRVCRPGGERNKASKISQRLLYNRYYKAHGVKYIVTVLSNGVMLLHGAYAGAQHDSPCFTASGLKQSLRRLDESGRGHWVVFGDSAFALDRYVQRMLRGAMRQSAAGARYNRRMAGLRIACPPRTNLCFHDLQSR